MVNTPCSKTRPLLQPGFINQRAAFSLIEVTLAIGIVSFAVLTVLGLLPGGLSTLRKAMDSTVESQIVQAINAKALSTPYTQLNADFDGKTFYYDSEGSPLGDSSGARPQATCYWATTTLTPPAFPGSESASSLTGSIWNLHITLMAGPTSTAMTKESVNIQVANSGN